MTLAFFALSGLDVLGCIQDSELCDPEHRRRCRRWIRSLYVRDPETGLAGFHGGTFIKVPGGGFLRPGEHVGHVAMTYTALASLYILHEGDSSSSPSSSPLEGLDLEALARGVTALQKTDGSFSSSTEGGESDMRFVFCAAAACSLLGRWDGFDVGAAAAYIAASITHEGGVAQGPGMEAHGGSTYCAIAALQLMGRLDKTLGRGRRRERLIRWCVNRLSVGEEGLAGFNGRPNKPVDTCYSFWVGASLTILRPFGDDQEALFKLLEKSTPFVLETQDRLTGGLAKWTDNSPDPLHTYLGLGGLALARARDLGEFDPTLNATRRATRRATERCPDGGR